MIFIPNMSFNFLSAFIQFLDSFEKNLRNVMHPHDN